MKIKTFDFPTFEEWKNNSFKESSIKLGAYISTIAAVGWTYGTTETTYCFAVSLAHLNPINLFTDKVFSRYFKYTEGDIVGFKKWYEDTICEFNTFWESHIKGTYLKE